MRRVLIAGCGYVGTQLARDLLQSGNHEVYVLRRSAATTIAGAHAIQADLAHGALEGLPRDLDAAYFCAAPNDSSVAAYEEIYDRALTRLLETLTRTSPSAKLVMTSSTSVYGQSQGELVDEESPTEPSSPSSRVILRGERHLRSGDVAVRLGGIYGPGRQSFINAVRQGTMVVNPNHSAYTNRIHRDDAAGILKFCGELGKAKRIYNGVDCECVTRAEVATWIAAQLGVDPVMTSEVESSSFLRGNKRVSNRRLLEAGYRFLYPSFREGYIPLLRQD
jgi:nucleoside-diphosphate-sugar epimerase